MPSYTLKFKVSVKMKDIYKLGNPLIPKKEFTEWVRGECMQVAEGLVAAGSETVQDSAIYLIVNQAVKEGIFVKNEI